MILEVVFELTLEVFKYKRISILGFFDVLDLFEVKNALISLSFEAFFEYLKALDKFNSL